MSFHFRCRRSITRFLCVALALSPLRLMGQNNPVSTEKNETLSLTLDQAVEFALSHYPAIRVAVAQASAANSGVGLAHTAYLPRTDLVWQVNRATRNNVFGLYFPQPIPLPISGPVLGTNNGTNVWGTATGFLFGWEPFDFGLRKARVNTARAQEKPSESHRRCHTTGCDRCGGRCFSHLAGIATSGSSCPSERGDGHGCWPIR